jgi:surfactin synthase thioesterase subunit
MKMPNYADHRNGSTKQKVICFSFAGGSSYSFNPLKKYIAPQLELVTIDYPGRGSRMNEALVKNIGPLVNDMYLRILPHIADPYVMYGHSMGGIVSYHLAMLLRKMGKRLPAGILITGCRAPSTWDSKEPLHDLPYPELKIELKKMGGIPPEILEDNDTMRFFEPILRADFSVVDSHVYEEHSPLPIPFKILTGMEEDISEDHAMKWQAESIYPLYFKQLSGGHFFIFDHPELIVHEMRNCFLHPG